MNIAGGHTFEQLLRMNRVNNQAFFLSGFSHSFSNPLNSILLAGDLLKNYTRDINLHFDELNDLVTDALPLCHPEGSEGSVLLPLQTILGDFPQIIQGINDSALRLKQLLSHLSGLTGRGVIAAGSDFDINRLVSLSAAMAEHQISVHTNSFTLDLEPDLPLLSGSTEQILQVILSLLMNALLSLPERSSAVLLSTSCNRDTGYVTLSVRDEGSGILPDIFPSILEPFFSTWHEHGCIGLGLTVSDRIIRNHGGEMFIDSGVGRGRGTNVNVSFSIERRAVCG